MLDTKIGGDDPTYQQLSQHGLTVTSGKVDSDAALTTVTRESPTIGLDSPSYCSTGSHDLHTGGVISFDDLYSRYHRLVYSRALSMTGSHEDAQDVLQETFLQAWKALPRTKPDSNYWMWLYVIASRVCINVHRKATRKPALPLEAVEGTEAECVLMEVPSEQSALVAFARLSEEQQRLCLAKADGYSQADFAARYGLTLDQLRYRLYRARAAYQRALEREEAA